MADEAREYAEGAADAAGGAAESVADNAGEVGEDVVEAVGSAIASGREWVQGAAGSVENPLNEAAGAVNDAGRSAAAAGGAVQGGAQAAGRAAQGAGSAVSAASSAVQGSAVAGQASEMAGDAVHLGVSEGGKVYDQLSASIPNISWGEVGEKYAQSREATAAALMAIMGAAAPLCDMIKVDVFRDAYQVLSLVLSTVLAEVTSSATVVWNKLSGIVALDLSFVIPTLPPMVWYVPLAIVGFICFFATIAAFVLARNLNTDEIREGHEAKSWRDKAKENPKTLKFVKYTIYAGITLYLPISRTAFQLLQCAPQLASSLSKLGVDCSTGTCQCSDWEYYDAARGAAVLLILLVTVALPLYTAFLITRNKPRGSPEDPEKRYDEFGDLVDYTDDMYNDDVLKTPDQQACPYQFLYKGYERKWAFYKVLVMVFKFALCLPTIFITSNTAAAAISVGICTVFSALSLYTTPFIDPYADVMDASGRVSTALSVGLGLIASLSSSTGGLMGVLINVAQAVNFIIMGLALALGNKKVKLFLKTLFSRVTLDDSSTNVEGPWKRIMTHWNIYKEAKARVWHNFWDSLILNECDGEVAERLLELQDAVAKFGAHRVRDHFRGLKDPAVDQQRAWVQEQLEGQDVYWDGVPHDGKLDDNTCFGKMYCVPYPFTCVFVWDASDDYAFITYDEFVQLAAKNQQPDIVAKRTLRQKLRALDGEEVHLEMTRMESHSVPDGMEEHRDSEGKVTRKQKYATVQVEMHYHRGTFGVSTNTKRPMSAGFKASIHYSDGHGVATAPSTGEQHQISNSCTVGHSEIGLTDEFVVTNRLRELLEDGDNQKKWREGLPRVQAEANAYRRGLLEERKAKEAVLSCGFWYYVYDNFDLKRGELVTYLQKNEGNDEVRSIPQVHKEGLDYLYSRVTYVKSHPSVMFWFVLWDSFWTCNKDLAKVDAAADSFDPGNPSSIAYQPMSKPDLDAWFHSDDARKAVRDKFVSDAFMTTLFQTADKYQELAAGGMGTDRATANFALTDEHWAAKE